jgi:protein-S-isoprenylcysteine O-methyltransferase Ste14
MISELIARQGDFLFRWRSYIILIFLPLGVISAFSPEFVEVRFGQAADWAFDAACLALAFIGLGIRMVTVGHTPKGTSGRNTANQVADTLNTTGMYSLVRNPLYLGNAVIYMAFALFTQNVCFVLVMGLFLVIYLERIIATEEKFLLAKFGEEYRQWAVRVPAFIPDFSLWSPHTLPFSSRNVLRREYSGFLGIIAAMTFFHYLREFLAEGETIMGTAWLTLLTFGAVVYLVLRTLKKRTTILDVPGR